jgi:hypothetical protein
VTITRWFSERLVCAFGSTLKEQMWNFDVLRIRKDSGTLRLLVRVWIVLKEIRSSAFKCPCLYRAAILQGVKFDVFVSDHNAMAGKLRKGSGRKDRLVILSDGKASQTIDSRRS